MESKKLKHDLVLMALLMILSVFFYFVFIPNQIRLSAMFTGNTSFSSRTFPNIAAASIFAVAGLGLLKAVIGLVKLRKTAASEASPAGTRPKGAKAMLPQAIPYLIYILIVAYCILFEALGYIIATIIVPPILMFALGCRKRQFYLYMYAFGALLYAIFKLGLRIPMP